MADWKPLTKKEVKDIVARQYDSLSPPEREYFDRIQVPLRLVEVYRLGNVEHVFVVADLEDGRVLYFEDVELGFEVSSLDSDGRIPEFGANQFELRHIVRQLIDGRV